MTAKQTSDFMLYMRLLREARPHWALMGGLFLLSFLATPLALLLPLPLKIAIDNVLGSEPLPAALQALLPTALLSMANGLLVLAAVALLAIALLDQLQKWGTSILGAYTGEKLLLDFRAKLFRHVQRLSLSYHDSKGAADSMYRIHWDAAAIQWVAVYGVTPFLSAAMTLAGMLYITAQLDWQLALVALGVAPPVFFITSVARGRLRTVWMTAKALESRAVSVVQETLSGLRLVKAAGREDHEQARFISSSGQGMRARIGVNLVEGAFELLVGLTIAVGTAIVLYLGVRRVQAGVLSLGAFVLVMSYLARLYLPFQEISKSINMLQSAIASAERAFALLDEPPDVVSKSDCHRLSRAKGSIAFQNVVFAYPDEDEFVLRDVSFNIEPGSKVAITGTTGAGKTTLVSLLVRFYDPTSGRILLDGIDLRDYNLADLRNQFSIALQEPILFSTSIAENISYAHPDGTSDQVVAAAKAANAHEFIAALPDGYRTIVGERGMRLSGGERQRIALARAFLKDAPVLILDEPTSSVDVATEAAIMEAMERLMQGRTTLMISHRLSATLKFDMHIAIEKERPKALRAQHTGGSISNASVREELSNN
jgi:ATP-binding cassette subfamily B protein